MDKILKIRSLIKSNDIPATGVKFGAVILCLSQSVNTYAETDGKWFTADIGASHLWDSNFFRDPEEISEQINVYSAGVAVETEVSRQKFSARWRARNYQHQENEQFDETLQSGLVGWNGAIGNHFNSSLTWGRESYLIDRWEAPESDVVSKDETKFVLARSNETRFSYNIGARDSKQKHSSDFRRDINYEERAGFVGVKYTTPFGSTLEVSYESGDREYYNRVLSDFSRNLDYDFDYDQLEVENIWKISEKTSTTLTFARSQRKGLVNDSKGDLALLDVQWNATSKTEWHLGYSYRTPALGETIDMPSKVQNGYLALSWNISPKIILSTRAEKLQRNYDDSDKYSNRTESQYNLTPLSVVYGFSEALKIKLDTGWHKNKSPIPVRNYESFQVTAGVVFNF